MKITKRDQTLTKPNIIKKLTTLIKINYIWSRMTKTTRNNKILWKFTKKRPKTTGIKQIITTNNDFKWPNLTKSVQNWPRRTKHYLHHTWSKITHEKRYHERPHSRPDERERDPRPSGFFNWLEFSNVCISSILFYSISFYSLLYLYFPQGLNFLSTAPPNTT